jgi:hypothetical protein
MLTDINTCSPQPFAPHLRERAETRAYSSSDRVGVIPGGVYQIGHAGRILRQRGAAAPAVCGGFASPRLVTNGEYIQFIEEAVITGQNFGCHCGTRWVNSAGSTSLLGRVTSNWSIFTSTAYARQE